MHGSVLQRHDVGAALRDLRGVGAVHVLQVLQLRARVQGRHEHRVCVAGRVVVVVVLLLVEVVVVSLLVVLLVRYEVRHASARSRSDCSCGCGCRSLKRDPCFHSGALRSPRGVQPSRDAGHGEPQWEHHVAMGIQSGDAHHNRMRHLSGCPQVARARHSDRYISLAHDRQAQ